MSQIKNLLVRINELQTEVDNLRGDSDCLGGIVHNYANLIQRLYVLSLEGNSGPDNVILNEINKFLQETKQNEGVTHVR